MWYNMHNKRERSCFSGYSKSERDPALVDATQERESSCCSGDYLVLLQKNVIKQERRRKELMVTAVKYNLKSVIKLYAAVFHYTFPALSMSILSNGTVNQNGKAQTS